jgi:hypothetical protein
VGVAVNVTDSPEHIIADEAVILTEEVTEGLIVIVTGLLLTITDVGHGTVLVISQVTISPLISAVVVNTALFVPAFVPFIFH